MGGKVLVQTTRKNKKDGQTLLGQSTIFWGDVEKQEKTTVI